MGCEEFGEHLVRERKVRRWSQEAFGLFLAKQSSQLGRKKPPVPIWTISRWENGHQWPDEWHAYCICEMLGRAPEGLGLESVLTPGVIAVIEASIPRRTPGGSRREVKHRIGRVPAVDVERM